MQNYKVAIIVILTDTNVKGHLQGSHDVALVPNVGLAIENAFIVAKIYLKIQIHLIICLLRTSLKEWRNLLK